MRPTLLLDEITEDVRKYAAEEQLGESDALEIGLREKSSEFVAKGAEIYAKT